MKLTAPKYLLLGFGLPLLFFVTSFIYVKQRTSHEAFEYSERDYRKDYVWKDIEVGTVMRFPLGGVGRDAKYYAVVAFKHGDTGHHYLLLQGLPDASPARPQLLSTNGSVLTYQIVGGIRTNLDLQSLAGLQDMPKQF